MSVDVLIVLYNSARFVDSLVGSLRNISTPITVFFLDNASQDGTCEALASHLPKLPFRAYFFRSLTNQGFARGVNLLARQGTGEFIFILNPDAELRPGCLEKLLSRATSDSAIGVCEARQSPREHPKSWDTATGETTWCSGAAALLRRKAFDEVGGFDQQLFFMYCEDVDLSWKLWLRGWKCIYVPDAIVQHYTQDLAPGKRRTTENYYTFRNSLFLFYRFGPWDGKSVCWPYLWKRLACSKYTWRSKILFVFAFVDHIRYIPHLLHTRHTWGNHSHPWIRLEETSLAG